MSLSDAYKEALAAYVLANGINTKYKPKEAKELTDKKRRELRNKRKKKKRK
jgi:hypothetical protein